jgi:DNA-binding IclR family transcriptional regulator
MSAADASPRGAAHSLTLERGLRVLEVLGRHPGGLSVSELAKELGTHRAGVYRLLGPLLGQHLVVRDDDGRHTLGVGLIELASRVRPRLQELAAEHLRGLADELGATAALTLRDGDEAVVALVVEPRSTNLHIAYRPGLRHPLDRAAPGIALLAALPERPGERPEVAEARARGWAYSDGELLTGARGVAVVIPAPAGRVSASISIVWIDDRDPRRISQRLIPVADLIGAGLHGGADQARSA